LRKVEGKLPRRRKWEIINRGRVISWFWHDITKNCSIYLNIHEIGLRPFFGQKSCLSRQQDDQVLLLLLNYPVQLLN